MQFERSKTLHLDSHNSAVKDGPDMNILGNNLNQPSTLNQTASRTELSKTIKWKL